jgi:hypothetical protein
VIAMAMAVESALAAPPPTRLLGWVGPDGFEEAA